jgi:serine/threonine protein kinase
MWCDVVCCGVLTVHPDLAVSCVLAVCCVQEWVPGGELFHHLDIEGSFSDAAACFYAANVLLALECLHARGIVYRDLKPENLLLDTKVGVPA